MARKKYTFHPPGYDPTLDRVPPRAQGLMGCVIGIVSLMLCCSVSGFAVASKVNGDKAASLTMTAQITPSDLPTSTLDDWSLTGTAVYWLTFTPTGTLSPTPTLTPSVTPSDTPTEVPTLDDWSLTGTAIYQLTQTATQAEFWTETPTLTPSVIYDPNHPCNGNITCRATPVGQIIYLTSPPVVITSPPQPLPPTSPPVIYVVTATPRPPTVTPTATLTLTSTETETPTLTPTETETETPTP